MVDLRLFGRFAHALRLALVFFLSFLLCARFALIFQLVLLQVEFLLFELKFSLFLLILFYLL